jgi:hypothetical protein
VIGAALGISALEAIAADTPCSGRKGASLAVISSFAKTARSAWASHALSAQRMMGVSEAPELQTSITLYLDRENLHGRVNQIIVTEVRKEPIQNHEVSFFA